MNIFFASSHKLSIPIAQALIDGDLVSGFITNIDKPVGRKKEISSNSFSQWAVQTNIPIYKPASSTELDELLSGNAVDLVITCAYGSFIRKSSLKIPKFGWLNIHFSILPKYRGAAPAQRALINGDATTGYSIFKLDEGLDTGPILFNEEVNISDQIGAENLLSNLANLAAKSLPRLINNYSNWKFLEQSGVASQAPKIANEEKRVDWYKGAKIIRNLERGMEINGGIHTFFRGEKLSIKDLALSDETLKPGELVIQDGELLVGTGDKAIKIKSIQPAGKNWMPISDWLNGARLKSGEKFE